MIMKKLIFISLAVMLLLAVSCKKNNDNKDKAPKDTTPEAIDLGIIVNGKNIKWASCNLGASKPYEYGDYYAWGEIGAKSEFTWETYKYATGELQMTKYHPGSGYALYECWDYTTKPDGPDGTTDLFPDDDVAHVKLKGNWRMPTLADFEALIALKDEAQKENSDYIWEPWYLVKDESGNVVKDAKGNEIHGLRITRKSTNAVLFLPAAGVFDGSETAQEGAMGFYWSSTLNVNYPDCANDLFFKEGVLQCDKLARFRGIQVRPVTE